MNDMLVQLEAMYRNEGILATDFRCRHKPACSRECNNFVGPKSTFISTGYERGDCPRLLFLSLDPGWSSPIDKCRLPQAVREETESRSKIGNKNRHWYRTHELAWYILRKFDKTLENKEQGIHKVKHLFAHANSAKCCQNKSGGSQADARLFRNCMGYLADELAVLRPRIVVTQGDRARWGMDSIVESQERIDKFACVARFRGRDIFWLHTYHPRAFGYFYGQRDNGNGWKKYANLIEDFIKR